MTPLDTQRLTKQSLRGDGQGLMDRLVEHLPHFHNPLFRRLHLFLLTLECTLCLTSPCTACSPWQYHQPLSYPRYWVTAARHPLPGVAPVVGVHST